MEKTDSITKKGPKFIRHLEILIEIARQNELPTGDVLRIYAEFNKEFNPDLEQKTFKLTKEYFDRQRLEMSEGYQSNRN
jgi:hypothetical protein